MKNLAHAPSLRTNLLAAAAVMTLAGNPPLLQAADHELARFEFQQAHMGVPIKLILYAADQSSANRAAEAAYRRIAQIDQAMSDYKSDSELSRLNRTAGQGKPTAVSDDLWRVLLRSQKLAEKTEGAFDVTVGPYIRLWRRARRSGEFPSAKRLAQARAAVSWRRLKLDEKRQTAELLAAGMRLDLGGIAAGYAADQALSALAEHGVTIALIDISGDVLVGDPPPGRQGWRIGIAPVTAPDGPPSRYLSLRRASATTSGDAFQHVVIDGKRYSHIVDPRTGVGLTDQSSVTVIAADAMTADSLATTVSVLGAEAGLKLIEQTPGAAAIIMRSTEQGLETCVSARFSQFEVRPPEQVEPNAVE